VLKSAGVDKAIKAQPAVLVGTALSPGEVSRKPDGTKVRTLWGELAWQLGGKDGYKLVADSDAKGMSPGSATLKELFQAHSPCLILIDEWVAYARQLFGKTDIPAGDFEAQSTFAQAITEAAKAASKTLVVASIPASKMEIGGDNGQFALETLKNVFKRVGKPWRPASADEGFEIVRRRLFEPIGDKAKFAQRDAVIDAFAKMYRDAAGDFPPGCNVGNYRRKHQSQVKTVIDFISQGPPSTARGDYHDPSTVGGCLAPKLTLRPFQITSRINLVRAEGFEPSRGLPTGS
jgi:uncharacterized protein